MSSTRQTPSAAIVVFPETTASMVYGMFDMFRAAGRDWGYIVDGAPGPAAIDARIVSRDGAAIEAANGIKITPHAGLPEESVPDLICIPELTIPPGQPLEGLFTREIEWLRQSYAAGAMLATACSGAMMLAEAGLLDGGEATTHWAYGDIMRTRYPKITVRTQRALVMAGEGQRIVMAGAGTSWLDLVLYLVARLVDLETAMQLARIYLIDWHQIGQQPFARLARTRQVDDALIARCQVWIADHYHEPAPVAAMTRLSGLAERSFKRRFELATGMAPLEYVLTLRLEEAKQMLEKSDEPIESIANQVGYEDAGFFSRLFRRHVGLTPAQYRKRFGAVRRALSEHSGGL